MGSGWRCKPKVGVVSVVCLAIGILALPAAALAQSSAANQYTPDIGTAGSTNTGGPAVNNNKGGSNGKNGGLAGTQDTGGVAGDAVAGSGTLPFTGYPLTPLILVIAILLAAGLAARAVAPQLDRRRRV